MTVRVIVSMLAIVAITAGVPTLASSLGAPSAEGVTSAKQELQTLQRRFEVVAERYNQARYELSVNERRLAEARQQMRAAQAEADLATDRLTTRAVAAYTGMGTQWEGVLNADGLAEFSDRLEFIGAIASSDAELAAEAENARQVARWAADEYTGAVETSREQLDAMSASRDEIERLLDQQEALYEQLRVDYEEFIAAQRVAVDEAATAETQPGGGTAVGGGGSTFVPPGDSTQAQIAVQAAYSVVGTRYVWGSSDPSVGLDCSGVTVYAWREAGVTLPHSSEAQYSSYPSIPLSAVQPGDLIYYGNYGPHIAIYVGGGKIIHASSPSPGGQTRVDSMYGYDEPWGAVRVA
ncbi:MAG: NlpC/P60 family protein [Actinomycetota bacterium]